MNDTIGSSETVETLFLLLFIQVTDILLLYNKSFTYDRTLSFFFSSRTLFVIQLINNVIRVQEYIIKAHEYINNSAHE